MRLASVVAVTLLTIPVAAFAQDDSSSRVTGPLQWNPNVQLKDFGYDSNVFNTPANPFRDYTGTLVPATDATLDLTHVKATGVAAANFQYFERATSQRALGGNGSIRLEFPVQRIVPSLSANYENLRDLQVFEIDTRVRHRANGESAGVGVYLGTRALVNVAARRDTYAYDATVVHDVDVASQLDRRSDSGTLSLRVTVTPITSVIADAGLTRDTYTEFRSKDQRTVRGAIGLEFAPDAIIRGHAAFGYHELTVSDSLVVPFKGYTADVDLSYLMLGVTRFNGRYGHDTATSIQAPYYVQTTYGLDIEQQFLGPTTLLGRYNRQLADYRAIPERLFPGHLDTFDTFGGGIGIHLSNATRMTLDYELAQRRSDLAGYSYDRERLTTSITMGF